LNELRLGGEGGRATQPNGEAGTHFLLRSLDTRLGSWPLDREKTALMCTHEREKGAGYAYFNCRKVGKKESATKTQILKAVTD
jgi:hypothetical protein